MNLFRKAMMEQNEKERKGKVQMNQLAVHTAILVWKASSLSLLVAIGYG